MFLSARNSWQTKDNKRLLLYMLLSSSTLLTSETFWHQKRQWNDFVTGALISSTNSIVIERCYRTNFLVLLSWVSLLASNFVLKFNGFLNNRKDFQAFWTQVSEVAEYNILQKKNAVFRKVSFKLFESCFSLFKMTLSFLISSGRYKVVKLSQV